MPSMRLDHGENGNDEGTVCLQPQTGSNRIQRYREWVVGDSKLSQRARVVAWTLVLLCVLLLIAVIVLAATWPGRASEDVCESPECLIIAAEEMQSLNRSLEPCVSPRDWACGGWMAENSRRLPDRPSWSMMDSIKFMELKRLREILSTVSPMQSFETIEWRLKTLYDSCMAEDIVEEDGYVGLSKMINDLGGWHALRNWNAHSWSWRRSLQTLHSKFGVSPLFVAALAWRDNATALHLRPAGLGMPHPSYYQLSSESKEVKAYKSLLKDAALSMGATSHDASRFADDIFAFEKRLADLILDENELYTETWMTMRDLNVNNIKLPFQDILIAMLPKLHITNESNVLVTSPRYITYLINVTTGTSPSILNDYFTWTLIRNYLPYMSESFRLVWKEYQNAIQGNTGELERWEFCTRLVEETVPLASHALLENEDQTSNLERARIQSTLTEMFELIRSKAIDTVVSSELVDDEIKPLMIAQLNYLDLQVGLKPIERTADFQESFYNGIFYSYKHNLFRNIESILESKKEILQGSFLDRDLAIVNEVAQSLTLTEASYNRHRNAVILPFVLVSKPYFDVDYPKPVQFGRLGVTMATAVARAMMLTKQESINVYPKHAAPTVHCLSNIISDKLEYGHQVAMSISSYAQLLGVHLSAQVLAESAGARTSLPVLTHLDGPALFAATYSQTLCSIHTSQQSKLDAVRSKVNGKTMFSAVWPYIPVIQKALSCSPTKQCPAPI